MKANLWTYKGALGWALYLGGLIVLAISLPANAFDAGHAHYWVALGAIAVWRYSLGIAHFFRAMAFVHWRYPREKRAAAEIDVHGTTFYLLITSFRIGPETTLAVYRGALAEARNWPGPVVVVASIVEMADEQLIRTLWASTPVPEHVRLKIVRVPGTGKRDGLAQGFRAISRDMPADDALVAVIDGDTVLGRGVLTGTAPYFRLFPNVGALTTNEFCSVQGSVLMQHWHRLRFAQRHIHMCSMALSHRVLTLTGRMSVFRASIVADPEFIRDVQRDELNHWRLGRFRFLTGDDKSSWFSLMRLGWDTWYVPDAAITTVEHPPDKSFLRASRMLMFRWYGNSLRQNLRATALGWRRLGVFTWYVLIDQRIAMWTSLLGLSVTLFASLVHGPVLLAGYLLWIGVSRLLFTTMLIFSGHRVSPLFPLLHYYNQIVGSITKIHVLFHLDQQSWTRQKTRLKRDLDSWQARFNRWSSPAMELACVCIFAAVVVTLV